MSFWEHIRNWLGYVNRPVVRLPSISHRAAYEAAKAELGVKETPGAQHTQKIIQYFAEATHGWVQDDETPWCAAFVNAMLGRGGYPGTNSLAARSFLEWGDEVSLDDIREGDVVVLWRKKRSGPYGHVGFFVRRDGGSLYLLGGNQSNAVNIESYSVTRLLSVRRYTLPVSV